MPKETFWNSAIAVEGDGVSEPVLTVTWGQDHTAGVWLNGVRFDESGIDRAIKVLKRAKRKSFTPLGTYSVPIYSRIDGKEIELGEMVIPLTAVPTPDGNGLSVSLIPNFT